MQNIGEECVTIAEKSGDIELIAPIAFDLCSNYGATGQFSRVIEIAPKVLASIEQEKMEYESFGRGYDVYSALSSFCAFSNGYMGNFKRRQRPSLKKRSEWHGRPKTFIAWGWQNTLWIRPRS